MAKPRPRRLTITVPPHLTAALDALATLDGRPRQRTAQAIVFRGAGASSTRPPMLQTALRRSTRRRQRLHLPGARPAS